MHECDKRNSHKSSKLRVICIKGKVFPLQAQLWPRGWVEL